MNPERLCHLNSDTVKDLEKQASLFFFKIVFIILIICVFACIEELDTLELELQEL